METKMYEPTVAAPVWKRYLPNYVNLYYVDYRDNLDDYHEVLNNCIQENSYEPLYMMQDYILDENPGNYEMEEIRRKMFLDGFSEECEEHEDEIREWLWDNDESTPMEDLLNHTSDLHMFYSLGLKLDCGWHYSYMATPWQNETAQQAANKVMQMLGIEDGTEDAEKVLELCECCNYGGELRIYFEESMGNMISDCEQFKTIEFDGYFKVAVWNNSQGSGDYVELKLHKKFPFVRENLQISDAAETYHIEYACGLCGDWLRGCDTPTFSTKKMPSTEKIQKSEAVAKEWHFQKVFDEGGCSCGDCNINRHRGIEVTECGLVCRDCGMTWLD